MAITFELNDSEIRVAKDTEIILRSPGYAVLHNDNLELGLNAFNLARLDPRTTYNHFWKNLNQDPLQYTSAQIRHNADLAYAHLLSIHEQVGKPEEVIFAIPGCYGEEQLSLLLGLVEACKFKAIGLVDSAIAAATPVVGKGNYVHLEIHLHQSILTHINVSQEVSRTQVKIVDGAGLADIYNTCATKLSDLFINQSRFDPQHHPETEQALYNQMHECLTAFHTQSELSVDIQYNETQHIAKLLRKTLLGTLQPLYNKIINSIQPASFCLIGDRLSNLPGFVEQLSDAEKLKQTSVFEGCRDSYKQIHSSGPAMDFITRLPATSTPKVTVADKDTSPQTRRNARIQACTHVLNEYQAYPLNHGCLYLSTTGKTDADKNENTCCSVLLNGKRVTLQSENKVTVFINGRQLVDPIDIKIGDVVSFAGTKTEYLFISVLN